MQRFPYMTKAIQKEFGTAFTCRGSSGRARELLALTFLHNSLDLSHFGPCTVSQKAFSRN